MQTQQEFGIFTLAKFEAFLKGDPTPTEVELYLDDYNIKYISGTITSSFVEADIIHYLIMVVPNGESSELTVYDRVSTQDPKTRSWRVRLPITLNGRVEKMVLDEDSFRLLTLAKMSDGKHIQLTQLIKPNKPGKVFSYNPVYGRLHDETFGTVMEFNEENIGSDCEESFTISQNSKLVICQYSRNDTAIKVCDAPNASKVFKQAVSLKQTKETNMAHTINLTTTKTTPTSVDETIGAINFDDTTPSGTNLKIVASDGNTYADTYPVNGNIAMAAEPTKDNTTMQTRTIKEIMQDVSKDFEGKFDVKAEDLKIKESEDTLGSLHTTLAKRKKELEHNLAVMRLRIVTLQEMCKHSSDELDAVQELLNFYS